jgi:hypothetical protein
MRGNGTIYHKKKDTLQGAALTERFAEGRPPAAMVREFKGAVTGASTSGGGRLERRGRERGGWRD